MRIRMRGAGLRAVVIGVCLCLGVGAAAQDAAPTPRPVDLLPVRVEASAPTSAPVAEAALGIGRVGPVTGFPLPRYVSMKSSEANARRGPSRSHRIDWVFQRRGMPIMVVAEHGHWRRIVDRDGAGGWVHYALLSGVRTAIVEADLLPLRAQPDPTAPVRANAERGVVGALEECRPDWCLMEVGGYRGWVEAAQLWGVDPGEVFD